MPASIALVLRFSRISPTVIFYKTCKDVSREFDEFRVNSLLIFASCVVGT